MSDFSIVTLVTLLCICVIAYYLGNIVIDIVRAHRKNRKKTGKKK